MSSRLSLDDLAKLGVPKKQRTALRDEARLAQKRYNDRIKAAAPKGSVVARRGNDVLQRKLYDALVAELGESDVEWERPGLVPGRRFRVDIFLPRARIAVEFDGFGFHRQKAAYQADRIRQNLLVVNGVLPLRYFAAQVADDERCAEVVREITDLFYRVTGE